jgi:DNA processing protein
MAGRQVYSDDQTFDWLALERVPRVGPITIGRLLNAFGSPRAAREAGAPEICRRAGLNETLARTIAEFSPCEDEILKDMELLDKLGARVVTRWDSDYPGNLKDIYDPPAVLFVRGRVTPEDGKAIAIVGTRNPSRYGLEMTGRIAAELARSGVTLVSGLARGIDTTCHAAAIKEGGRTIGVLGCGIDVVYPRQNKSLIEDVAAAGAVITEFRPGTPPLATNFFRRNRIVSGLSKGVLVVEAGLKSGSLITAHHAVDQNRDVFAVPGNVMNIRSRGPHHLLKDGAALVESAQDILDALFATSEPVQSAPFQPTMIAADAETKDLSETERRVLEGVDPDPVPIDSLCQSLGMEPGRLAGVLLELELKRLVRQHPGKMFSRVLR